MDETRVMFVGERPMIRAVGGQLRGAGYRPHFAGLGEALAEWRPEDAPGFVVVGPEITPAAVERICRHVKLHERFNLIPVLVLRRRVPPPASADHARVEPDLYARWPAAGSQLAEIVGQLNAGAAARRKSRLRFYLEVLTGSNPEVLEEVGELLTRVLWHSGLPESAADRVRYSVMEVGLNAIEWGNQFEESRSVRFSFSIYPDRFTARVADDGPGFDLHQVSDAEASPEPETQIRMRRAAGVRFGGYGVRVCRRFVDDVHYNEAGNEVVLTRFLPGCELKSTCSTD